VRQIVWTIFERTFIHVGTMAGVEAKEHLNFLARVTDVVTLGQKIHTLSKKYPDLWIRVDVEEI